ncbi:MAG: metal ABC transporter substrate-binding protein, partial [Coriobacteriales bacterium]|nr:metal ABC transporter substrate-binding protein [Coriobacteriales bacterium]
AAYTAELDRLDAQLRDLVAHATRTTVVFGDRFPFRYLAEEYGLAYFAAFPGCSTATEPNAQTIAFLINKVTTEHIPVVFYIELSNHSIADAICEQTGAQALLLHSIHNVSQDDFDAGVTYLSLMDQNIQNLKAALL